MPIILPDAHPRCVLAPFSIELERANKWRQAQPELDKRFSRDLGLFEKPSGMVSLLGRGADHVHV
jgi:hypothetical protein